MTNEATELAFEKIRETPEYKARVKQMAEEWDDTRVWLHLLSDHTLAHRTGIAFGLFVEETRINVNHVHRGSDAQHLVFLEKRAMRLIVSMLIWGLRRAEPEANADLKAKIDTQFALIGQLKKDWDDEGTDAFDPLVLRRLREIVVGFVISSGLPIPTIHPNREGGVDAQWMSPERGVVVEVGEENVTVISTMLAPGSKGTTRIFSTLEVAELSAYLKEKLPS